MKFPAIKGFDEIAFQKYLKNTGWLMVARAGSLAIKVLSGFAIANYLDTKQFGMLNYPLAFTTFFIAAAALGLDGFVTRELLRVPEKRDKLLGTAFILKLIGGITAIPVIYFAFQAYSSIKVMDTPVSFITIISFIGVAQAFNIIDSYFQSKVQARWVMLVQIGGNILSAGIKFLFIFL
ncbi:MAG: flippase, partial [Sphingobacteriales bacterium]